MGGTSSPICPNCVDLGLLSLLDGARTRSSKDAADLNDASAAIVQRALFDNFPSIHSCDTCRRLFDNYLDYRNDFLEKVYPTGFREGGLSPEEADQLLRGSSATFTNEGGRYYLQMDGMGSRSFCSFGVFSSQNSPVSSPVRLVKPQPDYEAIKAWLAHCNKNHPECQPRWEKKLEQISLIDVDERRLVQYADIADSQRQYLVLSYVWGGVMPAIVRKNEALPPNLPQTIEDSITVTRCLDIRYLWVDAVCIDQSPDSPEKAAQILIMDLIYECAFATIVAMDGTSANSGLPGVSEHYKRVPQLLADFGPNTLAELFPDPRQITRSSTWAQRGWTYQEGILSKRCIAFTKNQVYFHCHGLRCCEALDGADDFIDLKDREIPFRLMRRREWSRSMESIDAFRHPESSLEKWKGRFKDAERNSRQVYFELLNQYLRRNLSFDADGLNAFSALLRSMESLAFSEGFYYGLPRQNFRRSLLWGNLHQGRETRLGAKPPRERSLFPSWSWVGWKRSPKGHLGDVLTFSPDEEGLCVPFLASTRDGALLQECEASVPDSPEQYPYGVLRKLYKKLDLPPGSQFRRSGQAMKSNSKADARLRDYSLRITGLVLGLRCCMSKKVKAAAGLRDYSLRITGLVLSLRCCMSKKAKEEYDRIGQRSSGILAMSGRRISRNDFEWWDLDNGIGGFPQEPTNLDVLVLHIKPGPCKGLEFSFLWLKWEEEGVATRQGVGRFVAEGDMWGENMLDPLFKAASPRISSFWLN